MLQQQGHQYSRSSPHERCYYFTIYIYISRGRYVICIVVEFESVEGGPEGLFFSVSKKGYAPSCSFYRKTCSSLSGMYRHTCIVCSGEIYIQILLCVGKSFYCSNFQLNIYAWKTYFVRTTPENSTPHLEQHEASYVYENGCPLLLQLLLRWTCYKGRYRE